MAIALRRADGRTIGCVQIAGWVARRIVCYIKPGQAVQAGERFGHIRFGSRTDLYLPPGARLLVAAGQRMIGGETVMAELDPVKTEPGGWSSFRYSEEHGVRDGQRLSHPPRPVARLLDQPADPQRADAGGAVRGPDGDPLRPAGPNGARRHRHHRGGGARCARRPSGAAAGRHQPVRRGAQFALRFPLLRRDAGAGPLHVVADRWRGAGLGRHSHVPDVLGAAPRALQHRPCFRHAAARLDRLLFHRRAGAGRRAAGADSADGELRARRSVAASSDDRRRGARGRRRPDGEPPADLLVQEGQGAAPSRAAGSAGRGAGDGRDRKLAVDRAVAVRPGLRLAHSLQLDELPPAGAAGQRGRRRRRS